MIFITGGAWQGKLEFAEKLAENNSEAGIDQVQQEAESKQSCFKQVAEGKTDSFEAASNCRIIHDFHEYVRRLLNEGKSIEEFIEGIQRQNRSAIIISNELGCGIVPVNPGDRQWREASGRAAVKLAEKSEEVYRVICGIPARIK